MKVNRIKCRRIYPSNCKESCKDICPVDAIILKDKKARILQSKCIKCGACMQVCPRGAIK